MRSSSFKQRLLSSSILWLHLLLLNLKLLLLLRLHLLLLHLRLLLLLPTTQRSFAISSEEFHLRLSQAAGRRWSLRWLVKHRRLQLLWCYRVIVMSHPNGICSRSEARCCSIGSCKLCRCC